MRLLLIDNHDSFSAILHHYLWELAGERPMFFRNDELARDELEALDFDAAVLSPGPGHPANVRDFGVCRDLLELFPRKPVLGVCLGMQGMEHFAGARVVPWDGARHGRPSIIAHDGSGLFRDIPNEFTAIRYHSLVVDPDSLPSHVRVTARSKEDGQIMGVSFADRPWFGVQFHPESIGTEHGMKLLGNFLDLAKPDRAHPGVPSARVRTGVPDAGKPDAVYLPIPFLELPWREPAEIFARHFSGVENTFWLDGMSSLSPEGGNRKEGKEQRGWGSTVIGRADSVHAFDDWKSFRSWIDSLDLRGDRAAPWPGYRGGPIGHLAYELYRDILNIPSRHASGEPLARWMLPAGWLTFDADTQKAYAAWEGEAPPSWLRAVMEAWDSVATASPPHDALPGFGAWHPLLTRDAYTDRVRSLQESIARGDSYEACLTHAFATEADADPLGVFLRLRARNPAPYAAYLAFPDVKILSASPELFLEASPDGILRSRPIKGTRRRGADPAADRTLREALAASEKDAAENRMIVDLTRHDLARVCVPGSVRVPEFLRIEEHPAVFQMVSEVRGALADGVSLPDAIAACFPGGSMTGAPKERTVEILAALESEPRGIYSGALGYLTRGGAFTLAMVIRTLENRGRAWRTGCGGAVLADSDPDAEWREATVKARSVIDAAG